MNNVALQFAQKCLLSKEDIDKLEHFLTHRGEILIFWSCIGEVGKSVMTYLMPMNFLDLEFFPYSTQIHVKQHTNLKTYNLPRQLSAVELQQLKDKLVQTQSNLLLNLSHCPNNFYNIPQIHFRGKFNRYKYVDIPESKKANSIVYYYNVYACIKIQQMKRLYKTNQKIRLRKMMKDADFLIKPLQNLVAVYC